MKQSVVVIWLGYPAGPIASVLRHMFTTVRWY